MHKHVTTMLDKKKISKSLRIIAEKKKVKERLKKSDWSGVDYLEDPNHYRNKDGNMEKLLQNTIALGGDYFEFGRGDEPYKWAWAEEKIPLWNLLLFNSRWTYLQWQGDLQGQKLYHRLRHRK